LSNNYLYCSCKGGRGRKGKRNDDRVDYERVWDRNTGERREGDKRAEV
jgi:hypothetical protein